MKFIAQIINDNEEVIAQISADSFTGLEEEMYKLEREAKDLERSEDYPLGGMLEPYDIENNR